MNRPGLSMGALLIALLVPTLAAADHCKPGEFPGKTLYRTIRDTPGPEPCSEWKFTGVWSPVSICGLDGAGLWQRPCTYNRYVTDKTVHDCYPSRTKRFLAYDGNSKVVTSKAGPNNNSVVEKTTTRVCLSASTPPEEAPAEESKTEVHDPPDPGAGILITFSEAGFAMQELPPMPVLPPSTAFQAILDSIATRYSFAAGLFSSMSDSIAELDDPYGLKAALYLRAHRLFQATAAFADSLAAGVPVHRASVDSMSAAVAAFAGILPAIPGGAYAVAKPFLDAAVTDLNAASQDIQQNLNAAGPDICLKRSYFLQHLLGVGQDFQNFAHEASVATGQVSVQDPVGPALSHLNPNAPNPFRTTTAISFDLNSPGRATLRLSTADGRRIAEIPLGNLDAGPQRYMLDLRPGSGIRIPSGAFFYEVEVDGHRMMGKGLHLQ